MRFFSFFKKKPKVDEIKVNKTKTTVYVGDLFVCPYSGCVREILSVAPFTYSLANSEGVCDSVCSHFTEKNFLNEEEFIFLGNIND